MNKQHKKRVGFPFAMLFFVALTVTFTGIIYFNSSAPGITELVVLIKTEAIRTTGLAIENSEAPAGDEVGQNNKSYASIFGADSEAPLLSFSGGTEANNSIKAQNWTFVNVSLIESNFSNITYELWGDNGTIDNIADITHNGSYDNQQFGGESASGDVNGDGYPDLIVGAPTNGGTKGWVYIFYGGASLGYKANVTIAPGSSGDDFGYSVAYAEDINGDGYGDIIVGASTEEVNGLNASIDDGKAYVFYGNSSMDNTSDIIFNAEAAGDRLGISVAAVDLNGDGLYDMILGASKNDGGGTNSGKVYIFYGSSDLNASYTVNSSNVSIIGYSASDNFGNFISAAGDFNNDDYGDVIVGAVYDNTGGRGQTGSAYIYFGNSSMDTTADLNISGENANDQFGITIDYGDFNGDSFSDVVIGANLNNNSGLTQNGKAYIFYGAATYGTTWVNASNANVTFHGFSTDESLGVMIRTVGDINKDGKNEVLIGAPTLPTINGNGSAYVFYGGNNINGSVIINITGEAAGDTLGMSGAAASDFNRDGYMDIALGVASSDAGGTNRGREYIFLGSRTLDLVNITTYNTSITNINFTRLINRTYYYNASVQDTPGNSNQTETRTITLIFDTIPPKIGFNPGTEANNSVRAQNWIFINVTLSETNFANITYELWTKTSFLDNFSDINITGARTNGYLGLDIGYGDFNGDGYSDIAAGEATAGGAAGRIYIFLGNSTFDNASDFTLTNSKTGDDLGYSLAVCDFNGDGFSDVAGGKSTDNINYTNAGRVIIWLGNISMDTDYDLNISVYNASVRRLGISNSCGDFNNDGYADLISGAYLSNATGANAGAAFLYYGNASMDNQADVVWWGYSDQDDFGFSVKNAGDVNGDGYKDIIIGAYADNTGGTATGRAYIYYGNTSVDNVADVNLSEGSANDAYGEAVGSAGDFNGDGFDDVIVVGLRNDAAGTDAGAVYVYYGNTSMDNNQDWNVTGDFILQNMGARHIGTIGDLNKDGYSDLLIGADEGPANLTGKAWVYLGNASADRFADYNFSGEEKDSAFSFASSSAGDLNNDTFTDIAVGAYAYNGTGDDFGKIYVYMGSGIFEQINTTTYTSQTTSINFTNLINRTYYYNVSVWDTSGNSNNTETRIIILTSPEADNSAPIITLNTPLNNSQQNTMNINFTFIPATNDDFGVCSLWNNGTSWSKKTANTTPIINNSVIGINHTFTSASSFLWNIECNDSAGNANFSLTNFTVNIDTTNPVIKLDSPENSTLSAANVNFRYTSTEANLDACELWLTDWAGTNWALNSTNSSPTSSVQDAIARNLQDGTYLWNVRCNDSASNAAFNLTNYTLRVDTAGPFVNSLNPNGIGNNNWSSSLTATFGFNATEANADTCVLYHNYSGTYSVNASSNYTTNAITNFSSIGFAADKNNIKWNVLCNDTAGNTNWFTGTTNFTINVDSTFPRISFSSGTEANNSNVSKSWVYINVSVNESNEKNISFSLYNADSLVNESSYSSAVRAVNWTALANGVYYYNSTVYDLAGNKNMTETRIIAVGATSPAISSISAVSVTSSSAMIKWVTDKLSNSTVEYGLNTSYGTNSSDSARVANHSIVINNLNSNTIYHYRVFSADAPGNANMSSDYSFVTATMLSSAVNLTAYQINTINISYANIVIEIFANITTNNTEINLTFGNETPANRSINEVTNASPMKYIDIKMSENLTSSAAWYVLKMYYGEEDISFYNMSENATAIYWYNASLNTWQKLNSTAMNWVYATGINIANNFAWSNLSHSSSFALGGLLAEGALCTLDSQCGSAHCSSDYEGAGSWCASTSGCAHNGTLYSNGGAACYSGNLETCSSGNWSFSACSNGCSGGVCNSGSSQTQSGSGGGSSGSGIVNEKEKINDSKVIFEPWKKEVNNTNMTGVAAPSEGLFNPAKRGESCYDGIKNQNEENVDCGGSCEPCPSKEIPKKSMPKLPILLSIFVLIIITAAAFVFVQRHKTAEQKRKEIERESIRKLKNYVLSALAKGYGRQQISYTLEKAGWGSTYIENAFKEVLEGSVQEAKARYPGRREEAYADMHERMPELGYTNEKISNAFNRAFKRQ